MRSHSVKRNKPFHDDENIGICLYKIPGGLIFFKKSLIILPIAAENSEVLHK